MRKIYIYTSTNNLHLAATFVLSHLWPLKYSFFGSHIYFRKCLWNFKWHSLIYYVWLPYLFFSHLWSLKYSLLHSYICFANAFEMLGKSQIFYIGTKSFTSTINYVFDCLTDIFVLSHLHHLLLKLYICISIYDVYVYKLFSDSQKYFIFDSYICSFTYAYIHITDIHTYITCVCISGGMYHRRICPSNATYTN